VVTKHGRPAVVVIRFEDFLEWKASRTSALKAMMPKRGILENEEADRIFARMKDVPTREVSFE
jgi:hypothetical protein